MNTNHLSNFIRHLSEGTWKRIEFVRNKSRLRISEVTVTQNILFQFAQFAERYPTTVLMYEANSEKVNGNDIELFFITSNNKYIGFPCQAKICYASKKDTYTAIDHPVMSKQFGKEQQINSLLRYASKLGGVAIYLFYNYTNNPNTLRNLSVKGTDKAELYGCSFVTASTFVGKHYIKGTWNKPLPSFDSLHPSTGRPFYHLFETVGHTKEKIVKTVFNLKDDNRENIIVREYTAKELTENGYWVPLNTPQTEVFDSSVRSSFLDNIDEESFKPRFRIVFNSPFIDELAE